MSIAGIGTDLVEVARLARGLQRFGERYSSRILAGAEHEEFHRAVDPGRFLAKRFAAKEAFAKALGTGFRDGISLRQLAVIHDELGRPGIQCSGAALERLRAMRARDCHLSISDDGAYAVAFVILTAAP
jgi:holo-[acyl-carrier protein] synthase